MKPWVKISGQYCWNVVLSQQMFDALECIVDDSFLFQRDSALERLAFSTVQHSSTAAVQNFLPSALWPHNSPELNSTEYQISDP